MPREPPVIKAILSSSRSATPLIRFTLSQQARQTQTERRLNGPQQPARQEDDSSDQLQNSIDGNANDPKRQQDQPDQRIEHQGNQRQRPAEEEQKAPQEKLDHHRTLRRSRTGTSLFVRGTLQEGSRTGVRVFPRRLRAQLAGFRLLH